MPAVAETKPESATPSDPRRLLTLDQIIGHESARGYLRRCLKLGQLPQAILITGPAGVGKRTLAWSLVKEILAQGGDPATHSGAMKVARGTHPDVYLIDNTKTASGQIRVDDIRELEDRCATFPTEAEKKIALIVPADRMNSYAANALLKILEEPGRHLILILICNDAATLLPTIRSRCAPVVLEAVAESELVPWVMEKGKVTRDRAELAVRLSEGRPGHALHLAQSGALDRRGEILAELQLLRRHGFAVIFRVSERLATLGKNPVSTLNAVLLLLRDALSMALGADQILNADLAGELRPFAEGLSPEGALEAARKVESALAEADQFYMPQARTHFLEVLTASIGRELRRR